MKRIICPLYKRAQSHPKDIALVESKRALSFLELNALVEQTQHNLKACKISSKDRVGILLPNSLDYVVLLYALWRIKAVAVPLNKYLPKQKMDEQLKEVGAKFLICEKSISLSRIKVLKIKEVVARYAKAALKPYYFKHNQSLTILFTSGTTAQPKAALHSFGNYYYNALGSNANIVLAQKDRWLLSLPLFHVGGISIIFRTFLAGAAAVIVQDRAEVLKTLKTENITHISVVPTQFYRLLNSKTFSPRKLKCVLIGGGAASFSLIKKALQKKLPVYTTYGLTEMTSQVATSKKLKTAPKQLKARVLKHSKVKIGKNQEILVSGPTLFKGYIVNRKLKRSSKWFKTGDIGELYNNELSFKGRLDNMFISGGENIQPEEIEKHLLSLKGIKEALVVPKRDVEFGMRPVAFINSNLNRKTVISKLKKELPKYKVPDELFQLPKSLKTSKRLKVSRQEALSYLQSKRSKLSLID